MVGLPPGSILQQLYLKERILFIGKKKGGLDFIEVGSGVGHISKLLLRLGCQGTGVDMNKDACDNNRARNRKYIRDGKYNVINGDFNEVSEHPKVDFIISCMVIEHMSENQLESYFNKVKGLLKSNGIVISIVPSSMLYWGIEDEIAGHYKRFEQNEVPMLATKFDMELGHVAGLTYPISNLLFKLSNKIVYRNEHNKLALSQEAKTIYTGNRQLRFKTHFPWYLNFVLNPIALFPLHLVQKIYSQSPNCMVLYFELQKKQEL